MSKKNNGKGIPFLDGYPTMGVAICLVLLIIFLLCGHSAASRPLPVSEVLEKVRQRYGTADLEADFVQESHLKAMGIADVAKGHVYFRSPAMMHWHYQTPEEHRIITDGHTVWLYRPAENQVMLGQAAEYFGDIKIVDVFTDPERLMNDFEVTLAPEAFQEKGWYVLKLVPKIKRSNLATLYLSISKSTFDIV